VISYQRPPLQPGEVRGWFDGENPEKIHGSEDLITVGWAETWDPEFSSPQPISVMRDGKVIAVVTTQEMQAGA
jgi:hypothetical protein